MQNLKHLSLKIVLTIKNNTEDKADERKQINRNAEQNKVFD